MTLTWFGGFHFVFPNLAFPLKSADFETWYWDQEQTWYWDQKVCFLTKFDDFLSIFDQFRLIEKNRLLNLIQISKLQTLGERPRLKTRASKEQMKRWIEYSIISQNEYNIQHNHIKSPRFTRFLLYCMSIRVHNSIFCMYSRWNSPRSNHTIQYNFNTKMDF